MTTAAEDKYDRLMEIGAQVCDTEPCSCEGKRAKGPARGTGQCPHGDRSPRRGSGRRGGCLSDGGNATLFNRASRQSIQACPNNRVHLSLGWRPTTMVPQLEDARTIRGAGVGQRGRLLDRPRGIEGSASLRSSPSGRRSSIASGSPRKSVSADANCTRHTRS